MRGPAAPPLAVLSFNVVQLERLSVREKLRRVARSTTPLREVVTAAVEGLHICATGDRRLDLNSGRLAVDSSPLVDLLGDALEDFHEVVAQGYSRVQLR